MRWYATLVYGTKIGLLVDTTLAYCFPCTITTNYLIFPIFLLKYYLCLFTNLTFKLHFRSQIFKKTINKALKLKFFLNLVTKTTQPYYCVIFLQSPHTKSFFLFVLSGSYARNVVDVFLSVFLTSLYGWTKIWVHSEKNVLNIRPTFNL